MNSGYSLCRFIACHLAGTHNVLELELRLRHPKPSARRAQQQAILLAVNALPEHLDTLEFWLRLPAFSAKKLLQDAILLLQNDDLFASEYNLNREIIAEVTGQEVHHGR